MPATSSDIDKSAEKIKAFIQRILPAHVTSIYNRRVAAGLLNGDEALPSQPALPRTAATAAVARLQRGMEILTGELERVFLVV